MRVVLDTNVLVSAIVFGGLPGEIVKLTAQTYLRTILSPAIIEELRRVLREKFYLCIGFMASRATRVQLKQGFGGNGGAGRPSERLRRRSMNSRSAVGPPDGMKEVGVCFVGRSSGAVRCLKTQETRNQNTIRCHT